MPGSSGGGDQDEAERPRERADQAARHEGDEIGARRDAQRLQIARHRERDAPLDAAAAQPGVDHVLARAVAGDRDMARRAERRRGSSAARRAGWPRRTRERILVGVEALAVEARKRIRQAGEDQVEPARELVRHDRRARGTA